MARRAAAARIRERSWLSQRSPLHKELEWLWLQNERRFEGGHRVLDELWRFDWETLPGGVGPLLRDGITVPVVNTPWSGNTRTLKNKDNFITSNAELAPGEHYARRQDSAIYVNLMEGFATDITGHISKQAPAPEAGLDFGTLGIVRRREDIDDPTRAELFYYNADGIGSDGSQWDSFWSAQLKLAMATGIRWVYVDAPSNAPRRLRRPYLTSFSPRQVWNHHFENGRLEWAIIKIGSRRPKVTTDGSFEGNDYADETLLLVRQGNTDLGQVYKAGGWWRFDSDNEPIAGMTGDWSATGGEIPLAPLIYDRHDRMLGRPGLTELGNTSVALMNIQSAADFDAWDSAGSVIALRGVDQKGFNLFIRKVREGNRYAPLPTNEESKETPDLRDASQGAVVADVFDKRIISILKSADRIRGSELTSAPQASGLAQQAGFTLGNVPRLSLVAGNLETCQNSIIQWAENRWGSKRASGSVRWTKKFELVKLVSSAQAILQLEAIAGINSEELDTRVILAASTDEGFVPDSAAKTTIDNELRASSKLRDRLKIEKAQPQVPGARSRNMPPEPAQTNQDVKTQLDGPNVE